MFFNYIISVQACSLCNWSSLAANEHQIQQADATAFCYEMSFITYIFSRLCFHFLIHFQNCHFYNMIATNVEVVWRISCYAFFNAVLDHLFAQHKRHTCTYLSCSMATKVVSRLKHNTYKTEKLCGTIFCFIFFFMFLIKLRLLLM